MTPTPQGQVPEALRLAEWLEFAATNADMGRKPQASDHRRRAAAELRRLHAQVAALTAQPAAPQGAAYATTPDGEPSNVELRGMWYGAGGTFHGPNVETGTMPEAKLLP